MASAKYQELAREYLLEEIDGLAAWLEGNVKQLREEFGPDEVVMICRNSHTAPNDGEGFYTFASIQFEITHGDEIL